MVFNKGDFLIVEYTIRVKDTNTIIDTTDPDIAKRENIYESSRLYGPTLLVLGKNWLNQYVEEELLNMSETEEREIEVEPSKAFGERDPGKVKVYSIREFQRRGYSISIGDVVEISGARGIVKQVSGGRVVVDFNHPLAGKTLVYKIRVLRKVEEFNERVKALSSRHLKIPINELDTEYNANDKKLTIKIPGKYITRENISFAKLALAADIFELFKDQVSTLGFYEEIKR
ncbi:MAG: FKBP-type peptidyl-prolyl cis-trans isomerase [Desulfurococcaceae archaeon]